MLIDLSIGLFCALVGFVGSIWLLLVAFGDDREDPVVVPFADDAFSRTDGAGSDLSIPFIPMPGHLRKREEMVHWLTEELPKLTAAVAQSGSWDRTR
jgi:hypothetical protein